MPYGQLNWKQQQAVKAVIKGRHVHDLGCGDAVLSRDLLRFGASGVTGIDSNFCTDPVYRTMFVLPQRLTGIRTTFEEYLKTKPSIDVAFMSWPINREERGLVELTQLARTVIYLGKCTDGQFCGFPGLFKHFISRELLDYEPDRPNTLCIYGGPLATPREAEHEERAGLDVTNIQPYLPDVRRSDARA